MEELFLSLISGVIGGSLTLIITEVLNVKKDNNTGKQIALVVLKSEIEINHNRILAKNNLGNSLEEYIRDRVNYLLDKKAFQLSAWEDSKMEITRLNPTLGKQIFALYSFYRKLTLVDTADEFSVEEIDGYLNNYNNLMATFKSS